MFEEVKSKTNIASLHEYFLDVEARHGVDDASAIMNSVSYSDAIAYERSENAKCETHDSLHASFTGSYEKVCSAL